MRTRRACLESVEQLLHAFLVGFAAAHMQPLLAAQPGSKGQNTVHTALHACQHQHMPPAQLFITHQR